MNESNMFIAVLGIVATTFIGCVTYFYVVDSNNSKDIVNAAIARGVDPVTAACASQLTTNSRDVRSTCEKASLIKGK